MKNEEIVQRFDLLYNERQSTVDQVWDLIERFVLPLRGEFYETTDSENEVDWHRRDIYDSTAVVDCQSLAASMQGNLTSSGQQWFELLFSDSELNDNDAAKEWLEECSRRMYAALNESNFDVEVSEVYLDLVGFGTAIMTQEIDEKTQDLNFSALSLRDVVFEENAKKQVDKLYRCLEWTAAQMIDKFGEENVPQKIRELAADPKVAVEKKKVIFCIFPRKTPKELDMGKPVAAKARPFGFKYVLADTKEQLGEEGGFYEMPAYVSRWRKTAGSKWGYSPAIVALGDILSLNQLKEAVFEAAGKAIDPANLAEDNALMGDLNLERGSLTIVSDLDGIKPYESGARFDVSSMTIDLLVESIHRAFFQDQLQLKDSPAMTATESNIRYELMQRLLGPTLGRLKTDFLDPCIQRTFNILWRQGALPEVPEGLEIDDMAIEYNGPLPRAQRAGAVQSITTWMESLASVSEVFPQILDNVDEDMAAVEIGTRGGVPSKVIRSKEEVERIRQDRAEQQKKQAEIEEADAMGGALESLGKGATAVATPEGEAAAEALQ